MRTRGLLIAAGLLAVLGGLVYWSNKAKKAEESKPTDTSPKLLTLNEADIRKVEIRRLGGEDTILSRDNAGQWQLTAPTPYPLDQDAVSTFMSSLASVSADKLVDPKMQDFAPFGLKNPVLTLTATMKDGKTHTLQIGDDAPTGDSAYARLAGDPRLFTIASYTKAGLEKNSGDFRDKRLLRFDSGKIVRVELTAKNTTTEFGRNNQNEWQIVKPAPMRADGWQVDELVRRLREAKLDPTLSKEDAQKNLAAFAIAAPLATAKVTDASGTQTLEVHKTQDNKYLARSSTVEGVYSLTDDAGSGLDKATNDFRNKKLFDFGFSDPNKVEYKDSKLVRTFVKAGDRWLENNKTVDAIGVQSLIDHLRDLSATSFPPAGFTTPEIELTVTSNDGKRVEHVSISKTPTDYIARREGEPALYAVATSSVDDLRKAAADVKLAESPKAPAKK
jgi:hypothetical protein